MATNETVIDNYNAACDAVLKAFCERHEFNFERDAWVGGQPGGIAAIADYFVSMQTMVFDVQFCPREYEFIRWTDYCERLSAIGIDSKLNFEHWCLGAPRLSEKEISNLEQLKQQLNDTIEDYKAKEGNKPC